VESPGAAVSSAGDYLDNIFFGARICLVKAGHLRTAACVGDYERKKAVFGDDLKIVPIFKLKIKQKSDFIADFVINLIVINLDFNLG